MIWSGSSGSFKGHTDRESLMYRLTEFQWTVCQHVDCSSLCICLRLLQASASKNVLRHTRQEVIYSLPSSVCQWVMAMLCERVGEARRISPFGFFILSIASKNSRPSNCVGSSFHGNHVHSQKSGVWMCCWLLWRLFHTRSFHHLLPTFNCDVLQLSNDI